MTHELPNMERVTEDLYVVRTQAGFRKALKEFNGGRYEKHYGYPRSYPALAHFTTDYAGYHYIQVHCWPVSKIAEVCTRHTPEPVHETPEKEGARMFHENIGLSNVWGSCSERNFPHIGKVLDAYVVEAENAKAT